MSKCYDRVNIYMLEKAMLRLKLPQNFIEIIKNLFTNRKNRIFTAVGMTDPYDVLIGIDQGEIISPLLWCIYYDPLLCEVANKKLGYNIKVDIQDDIYINKRRTEQQMITSLAYMDDMQWVTESK